LNIRHAPLLWTDSGREPSISVSRRRRATSAFPPVEKIDTSPRAVDESGPVEHFDLLSMNRRGGRSPPQETKLELSR
jgi:hypothetical protein